MYINFTLPPNWYRTLKWYLVMNVCACRRLCDWVYSILSSWIWAFGVSNYSQSHKLQKRHCQSKDHVLQWMDNNKWIFHGQQMLRPWLLQPTFCWFSSPNQHKHMPNQSMRLVFFSLCNQLYWMEVQSFEIIWHKISQIGHICQTVSQRKMENPKADGG